MNHLMSILPMLIVALILTVSCEKRKIERKVEEITTCCFANAPKRLVYYEEDGVDRTNWFIDSVLECDSVFFYFGPEGSHNLYLMYICSRQPLDTSYSGGSGSWTMGLQSPDSLPKMLINFQVSTNYLNAVQRSQDVSYYRFNLIDYTDSYFILDGYDIVDHKYKRIKYENQ